MTLTFAVFLSAQGNVRELKDNQLLIEFELPEHSIYESEGFSMLSLIGGSGYHWRTIASRLGIQGRRAQRRKHRHQHQRRRI